MMLYLQELVDGMNALLQRERAETQLTLGKLIEKLKAMPKDAKVANLRSPHSYRGYYSDLAFELIVGNRPAIDLLNECQRAMGRSFGGYKGGDFVMGERTPLWVSEIGHDSGLRLMDVHDDGSLKIEKETC